MRRLFGTSAAAAMALCAFALSGPAALAYVSTTPSPAGGNNGAGQMPAASAPAPEVPTTPLLAIGLGATLIVVGGGRILTRKA